MDNKLKKENRGGARANTGGTRPGAGRPCKLGVKRDVILHVKITKEEREIIKSKADAKSMSVSDYIRDSIGLNVL